MTLRQYHDTLEDYLHSITENRPERILYQMVGEKLPNYQLFASFIDEEGGVHTYISDNFETKQERLDHFRKLQSGGICIYRGSVEAGFVGETTVENLVTLEIIDNGAVWEKIEGSTPAQGAYVQFTGTVYAVKEVWHGYALHKTNVRPLKGLWEIIAVNE